MILPLAVFLFVPAYYKFWFYPTTTYYTRFIKFTLGVQEEAVYFGGFSANVNRNYKIAEFLTQSSRQTDRVFMWDPDSAAVYALSKRLPPIKYVADYHINDYSSKVDEAENIASSPPKFIILSNRYPYPELSPLLKSSYLLINQVEGVNIYSRIDFAPTK